ncbi:hypothetical protein ECG_00236 [Echinococcus granulosus]|uniref:Expressed protein n=1 Tax=Echinococcus granulosus TaxID=6210 RepID=A0A068WY38_ECHGR|nr:hypothetical protein ECG_00236 [Echinococcus granulosus]CDS22609.1 expressed protein [Echinococcus granulosus]
MPQAFLLIFSSLLLISTTESFIAFVWLFRVSLLISISQFDLFAVLNLYFLALGPDFVLTLSLLDETDTKLLVYSCSYLILPPLHPFIFFVSLELKLEKLF